MLKTKMVGSQSFFGLTRRGNSRSAAGRVACDDGEVGWGVGRGTSAAAMWERWVIPLLQAAGDGS